MHSSRQTYSSLHEAGEVDDEGSVLVHVAEPSRARWNHIDDLDSFFSKMYRYHQRHGFSCMLVQEILELNQFIFVVTFTTYLIYGIDYPVLFKDVPPKSNATKVTLHDVVRPVGETVSNFTMLTWVILMIASAVWILKLIRGMYHLNHFWDIKQFYNTALKIEDKELDNLTWHEVQTRVRRVQVEQLMCIHKTDLTELDIYHRILRQQNYLIAMVNKRLLPPRLKIPFLGEIVYWTHGLRYNVQLLLFWSPWAPFQNPWHLREEYRKQNLRQELASRLQRHVMWLALANFLLSPLVLLWQILYAFFGYAEIIRREPGMLGIRHWSLYGRLYMRHFNELDHELQARLTRAHKLATNYLAAFTDPMGSIIARYFAFLCGGVLAVLLALTVYDEDVVTVEHVLSIVSLLGVTLAICKSMIPDETMAWCPETLLSKVLMHTHYLPNGWKGNAHTSNIRSEFQQLFQLRISGVLEELLSPILTPYVLMVHIYPRVLDIVDFYRNFTVSVVGVGDVCSFAQMDIRKHGNPEWQAQATETDGPAEQYQQAEDGKVELSLIHFTNTNPNWKPPIEVMPFVESVHHGSMEMSQHESVLHSSRVERERGDIFDQGAMDSEDLYDSSLRLLTRIEEPFSFTMGMSRHEGPHFSAARDMSYSAMYLSDRHYNHLDTRRRTLRPTPQPPAQETTPLLISR